MIASDLVRTPPVLDPIQTGIYSRQALLKTWFWPILIGCALLAVIIAWVLGWPGSIIVTGRDQNRLNRAVAAPTPEVPIRFTFTPIRDGLTEIELIVVNFEQENANLPLDIGGATLTLVDQDGTLIARRDLDPAVVKHNDKIKMRFDPIPDSGRQEITLFMDGESGNPLSLWGYSLNVWPGSRLMGPATEAETLTFKTRYAFQWRTTPEILAGQMGRFGAVLFIAVFWLPLPGLILSRQLSLNFEDPTVRFGVQIGLGISVWVLIWYWLSLIGLWFSGALLWMLFIAGWGYLLWGWYRNRDRVIRFFLDDATPLLKKLSQGLLPMALFLGFVLIIRLLAVRDLTFLPWVDASRHALITAVMRDSGQFLENYSPYLPVDRRPYHYGFHVISASMALMLGRSVSLPDLLLGLMQLLSTLTTLAVYTGAVILTQKRAVGWLAALMVSLPFLFPAYYTTWGRLTQITGVILMPILMALLWQMATRSTNRESRLLNLMVIAFLAAALFLIHARVFLFFIPFAALVGLHALLFRSLKRDAEVNGWRIKPWREQPIVWLAGSGLVTFLLIAPRLYYLWQDVEEQLIVGSVSTGVGYYRFPSGYLSVGWETNFWWAIGIGSFVFVGIAFSLRDWPATWVSDRFATQMNQDVILIAYLIAWFGLLYLLVAGPGLRPNWPIILPQTNLNSAYITLFMIQAILLGMLIWAGVELLTQIHWLTQLAATVGLGLLIGATTLFGIKNQLSILNETTILAYEADIEALEWIEANLPDNAKIAHSSWRWLQTTWAGSDGGAWITPLTGRLSSIPPVDHQFDPPFFKEVRELNIALSEIDDWSSPDTLDQLRLEGFRYIFIGEKGGFFDPAELYANPNVEILFDNGRAWVFEIE